MKDGKDPLSEIPSIVEKETTVQPEEKKNFLTHADTDSSGAGGMSSPDE